ncbi:MAG: NAD(P)H-binding protein [Candidatus Nanopelagicales bacterium]
MTAIAFFGGTGRTGLRVLERALAGGHEVRVLVRDSAKLGVADSRVQVVVGDVLDAAKVGETVAGAEVVLSLFGQVKGSPRSLQTDGTRHIVDAEGHLQVLRGSGLEWTVVRGPRLTEQLGRGTYRVGWVGVDASTQISRDDLADFILTQVHDHRSVGQLPFVSN